MTQAEHDAVAARLGLVASRRPIGTWQAKVCDDCGAFLHAVRSDNATSGRGGDEPNRCRSCDPETWHRMDLEAELSDLNDRVEGAVCRRDDDAVAIVRRMLEVMVELGWKG